jgi:nucleoside-diphosphate-sugar epimerase
MVADSELLDGDLDEIISNSLEKLKKLDGSRISILGGTGFIGKWLVSSLLRARYEYKLNYEINIVTRSEQNSTELFAKQKIRFIEHDLTKSPLALPPSDYFVHGSTPSVPSTGSLNSSAVINSTLNGSISILGAIEKNPNVKSALFLSSGAVYGQQPLSLSHQPEEEVLIPNLTTTSYGMSKIQSEILFSQMKLNYGIPISTPRLFAFYGPHLALNDHFAIGNFFRDAREGQPIRLMGNPQTTRSYMYPTDLIKSLIELLVYPDSSIINLGSSVPISMINLAESVRDFFGHGEIQLSGSESHPSNYVPETRWLQQKFGESEQTKLQEGLKRWESWLTNRSQF